MGGVSIQTWRKAIGAKECGFKLPMAQRSDQLTSAAAGSQGNDVIGSTSKRAKINATTHKESSWKMFQGHGGGDGNSSD